MKTILLNLFSPHRGTEKKETWDAFARELDDFLSEIIRQLPPLEVQLQAEPEKLIIE